MKNNIQACLIIFLSGFLVWLFASLVSVEKEVWDLPFRWIVVSLSTLLFSGVLAASRIEFFSLKRMLILLPLFFISSFLGQLLYVLCFVEYSALLIIGVVYLLFAAVPPILGVAIYMLVYCLKRYLVRLFQ
jgi:hypothetical protein